MDYKKINVPYLDSFAIKKKADSLRAKLWGDVIPVDIEAIIEFELKIEIIPIPQLQQVCDTDAFITSTWKAICVDERNYMDERYRGRLRFSLAHEIGHFILHKEIYEKFDIKNIDDFRRFIPEITQEQYSKFEVQADIFANNLLIPRDKLIQERDKHLSKISGKNGIKKADKRLINSYIARPIAKKFEVTNVPIEIALNTIND